MHDRLLYKSERKNRTTGSHCNIGDFSSDSMFKGTGTSFKLRLGMSVCRH